LHTTNTQMAQMENSKFQAPNSKQKSITEILMTQINKAFLSLDYCNLDIVWYLKIVIWDFYIWYVISKSQYLTIISGVFGNA